MVKRYNLENTRCKAGVFFVLDLLFVSRDRFEITNIPSLEKVFTAIRGGGSANAAILSKDPLQRQVSKKTHRYIGALKMYGTHKFYHSHYIWLMLKTTTSLLTLLLVVLSLQSGFSQSQDTPYDTMPGMNSILKPAYQAEYPEWAQVLYQYPTNYTEAVTLFNQSKDEIPVELKAVSRYFKLWLRNMEPFVQADGTITVPNQGDYYRILRDNQLNANQAEGVNRLNSNWTFLGPKETFWLNESDDPTAPAPCPWQANIYSFDVSSTNTDVLYCGTETGFVNRSQDNGITWELTAPNYYFGGGVTALAISPTDENVAYAAAGNQVHKTTDGGAVWIPLLDEGDLFNANRLKIDPQNPNTILAAANDGIYLSTDAGASWERTWTQSTYDVILKADDSFQVYGLTNAGGNYSLVNSADGGATFSVSTSFPTTVSVDSGGLLGVSAADPNMILSVMLSSGNTPVLYKADLELNTWNLLATGQTADFPLNNGQGYYDLALEIDPQDSDLIFVGTTTVYKSSNGGQSFTAVGGYAGDYAIHPDVQHIKMLSNGNMWIATDGGFTFSTDHYSNTSNYYARNNGLVGSDMWGFDQGWNEDIAVGGRYHNGNTALADFYQPKALRMGGAESPTGWVLQGKSKHVAFNDLGNGWILPSTAEGAPEGRFIYSKYPNMFEYGGRRSNMIIHPNYYGQISIGEGDGFWTSLDMGVTWDLSYDFGSTVKYIQRSYSNPDVIYADIDGSGLHKSSDGGLSWDPKPSLTQSPNGSAYWEGKLFFAVSHYDENTIYACLQNGTWSGDIGEIYKSTDGGDTWVDWTSGVNEYTKNLVIQPTENGQDLVYLFTSARNGENAKVHMRYEDGAAWELFDEGYPAGMQVNLALPFFRDSKLRVAGNSGIWESDMEETAFTPILNPWVEKSFYNCMTDTLYFDDHSIVNHENVEWHWEITPEPAYISDANSRNPRVVLGQTGSYTVDFTLTKNGQVYNKVIPDMVTATTCPSVEDCGNPGDLPKEDWELIYVDSEETGQPGLAIMAFDNDPATIWHTRWSSGTDPYPHEMQVDLGADYKLYNFTYLARQVGANGRISEYELYITDDLGDWGVAVYTGTYENSSAPQTIDFENPPIGRYFKIVALSEVNGGPWSSVAEFSFVGCSNFDSSLPELASLTHLKAFPIPTAGFITVALPTGNTFNYSIYTLTGKLSKEGRCNGSNNTADFDLTDLTAGSYIIVLKNELGGTYRVKVVRE